jgi:hypothetical protein
VLGWTTFAVFVLSPLALGFGAVSLLGAELWLGGAALACAALTMACRLASGLHWRVRILAMLLTGGSECLFAVWLSTTALAVWPDFDTADPTRVKVGYAIGAVLLHVAAACLAFAVPVWFAAEAFNALWTWTLWFGFVAGGIGLAVDVPAVAVAGAAVALVGAIGGEMTSNSLVAYL